MRKGVSLALLFGLIATAIAGTRTAAAQQPAPSRPGQVDISLTYTTSHSNFVPGDSFWMQGGDVEVAYHLPARFDGIASFSGGHTGPGAGGVPLNLITTVYGPRYTWTLHRSKREVAIFGQGLAGTSEGLGSTFPHAGASTTSASSLAIQAGGGVNIGLSPHWAIRAGEVQWLRTELPNSTTSVQNSVKIGAGIVVRFQAIR